MVVRQNNHPIVVAEPAVRLLSRLCATFFRVRPLGFRHCSRSGNGARGWSTVVHSQLLVSLHRFGGVQRAVQREVRLISATSERRLSFSAFSFQERSGGDAGCVFDGSALSLEAFLLFLLQMFVVPPSRGYPDQIVLVTMAFTTLYLSWRRGLI